MTEWITPEQWKMRYQSAELDGDVGDDGTAVLGAPVIILGQDIGFEYPDEASALLAAVEGAGADRSDCWACSALSPPSTPASTRSRPQGGELPARPLCLFVGTPSRRRPAANAGVPTWSAGGSTRPGSSSSPPPVPPGASDRQLADAVSAWAGQASTTWVPVMEARPEVTRRRDAAARRRGWRASASWSWAAVRSALQPPRLASAPGPAR